MLRVISLLLAAQTLFPTAAPGVGASDAYARASGNLKPLAVRMGRAIFRTEWPAQVLNVYESGIGAFRVAGLHVSGVHFHHALSREQFLDEIAALVHDAFAASSPDEVDVWATVPIRVGKDIVVSGDLAKPASRTVFSVSVRRGESADALLARMRQGTGVFWDQEWARTALK